MRAPSLLSQCLPGLINQEKSSHCVNMVPERDLHHPSPAVEIVPSKNVHPYKYAGENIEMQGLNVFKGKVSVADVIGISKPDAVSLKTEGTLKSWENSIDIVNVLKNEIRDGLLSFRSKRILELGCGYGLSGIFACLKGASTVHFQDPSAETIRCKTIPNVLANLEQARDRLQSLNNPKPESPLTPSRQLSPTHDVHFYAGDWDELPSVLSLVSPSDPSPADLGLGLGLGFYEEDFNDGYSSQDGSSVIASNENVTAANSSRRSRKLSGSRAWERGNETDSADGGYDIVLINEIPYLAISLQSLYSLIKKCLRPPYGILYLGAKKNYIGSSGAVRQLKTLVDEEGIFGTHLVSESADREIWKFFFK